MSYGAGRKGKELTRARVTAGSQSQNPPRPAPLRTLEVSHVAFLRSLQQMVCIRSTKKKEIKCSLPIGFLLSVINLPIHYCISSIRDCGGRAENVRVVDVSMGRLFMFRKYFCLLTVLIRI